MSTLSRLEFRPSLHVVPPTAEIPFYKHRTSLIAYLRMGFKRVKLSIRQKLGKSINTFDPNEQELDINIAYRLFSLGYTKQAIRDYWHRRDNRLNKEVEYSDECINTAEAMILGKRVVLDKELWRSTNHKPARGVPRILLFLFQVKQMIDSEWAPALKAKKDSMDTKFWWRWFAHKSILRMYVRRVYDELYLPWCQETGLGIITYEEISKELRHYRNVEPVNWYFGYTPGHEMRMGGTLTENCRTHSFNRHELILKGFWHDGCDLGRIHRAPDPKLVKRNRARQKARREKAQKARAQNTSALKLARENARVRRTENDLYSLIEALKKCEGNRIKAADMLNWGRSTVDKWVRRHGLDAQFPPRRVGRPKKN